MVVVLVLMAAVVLLHVCFGAFEDHGAPDGLLALLSRRWRINDLLRLDKELVVSRSAIVVSVRGTRSSACGVPERAYKVVGRLLLDLLKKLLLVQSVHMTTPLTVLIRLSHNVPLSSHLIGQSYSRRPRVTILLLQLNSTKLARYFLHRISVLTEACAAMRVVRILVGHVLLLMLVVELSSIGRGSALRNEMPSPHERSLIASSITVFRHIVHPLGLGVLVSHRLNVPRRSLWRNSIISMIIIILSNFGLVIFPNDILLIVVLLLLRYLEAFCRIAADSFGSAGAANASTDGVALFRASIRLMPLLLYNELLPALGPVLALQNLHLVLVLEVGILGVEAFQLFF